MLRLYSLLALSAALLAGCSSTASSARPVTHSTTPSTEGVADREDPTPDPSSEKAAQAHAHYAAGVVHDLDEEPDAALEEYYQAGLADPADETLVLEVSRRLLQKKEYDKALELLTRATVAPKASGVLFARLGLVYSELGKTDLAIGAAQTAIKRSPNSIAGYQNLFVNLLQTKQEEQALKLLDQASRIPSADAEFLIGLSELYQNLALQSPARKSIANPKALALLNRAEKSGVSGASLRLKLADGFAALGATDKAAQIYLDLLKKLPDVPFIRERVHAQLADIYLRGSDRKKALEQLQEVVRDDPTNPQANYWLGSLMLDDKKPDEAAEYFSKTILLTPDFEQAYYELASAQIDANKTSDALATLDKARAKFPQSFVMEFLAGAAFSRQKAWSEAIRHYTAAEVVASADPKHLNQSFYFQLGAAYERNGDYAQAEKYFQKCLQLAPDYDEALNYLGYMWAERGTKLPEARHLIEKAVKADPKNAAYLDSLGWVLFKLNQPKEALDYELKAIQLSEEPDPTVYDHLGDIYAALQQPDKARQAWQKSLSLEANDAVRKKLDSGHPH